MSKNETKLDAKFVACATCQYWSGKTKYVYPYLIIVDNDNQYGACNGTYFGANTSAYTSCQSWRQRY